MTSQNNGCGMQAKASECRTFQSGLDFTNWLGMNHFILRN
ncbi:hypothetical protein JCM19238_5309 [Vibrio ponticus]|nr:hypothetical protein JCM19238_5309 [Vibrio ponticus]